MLKRGRGIETYRMSYIEGPHSLLEAQAAPYSNATVRRAFIVWMHCGQRNCFKSVCDYYHRLESLEEKLPADRRATSRRHEFNMFSNPPPTSPYLDQIFPKLYSQSHSIQHYIKNVDIKTDAILDFNDTQNGVTTAEILDASNMIKKYCKSRMITLKKFLTQFKEYARKCGLNYTVNNVAFYIKRKMVEEELLMVENYSKSLNFLNFNVEKPKLPTPEKLKVENVGTKMSEEQLKFFSSINAQKHITILTRDRRDLLNHYWNNLSHDFSVRNSSTKAW